MDKKDKNRKKKWKDVRKITMKILRDFYVEKQKDQLEEIKSLTVEINETRSLSTCMKLMLKGLKIK